MTRLLFTVALVTALLIGLTPAALAQSRLETFRPTEHYVVLPVPTAGSTQGGLLVQELFSYACIHCHRFEALLTDWADQLPEDVRFERVPAVFSRGWLLLAKAYYVAEVCGVLDFTHDAMFSAIHEEGRQFEDGSDIARFYAERMQGQTGGRCRSRADFLAAFESLEVAQSVQQALALSRVWQVGSVPTLVVSGQWRTDGRLAGSHPAMLEVADYLLRRSRAEAQTGDGDPDY